MAIVRRPSPIEQLGAYVVDLVTGVGELVQFVLTLWSWMLTRAPSKRTIVPNFYQIGVRSVPVVAVTGTFIGMVLAVQAYGQFKMMGLETRLGIVINVSVVTELGPVLAATMLAGRVGGAMAAEIGTMKVTEQIDALRCIGVEPIHYLVAPRFMACVILIPLLTIMADFMGVIGGAIVSIQLLGIDAFHYWKHSREAVGMWELSTGLLKSIFFGAQIAIVSCHTGFKSSGGSEGVGRAATDAFVASFIAILVSDFMLGMFLQGLYDHLWPGYRTPLTG